MYNCVVYIYLLTIPSIYPQGGKVYAINWRFHLRRYSKAYVMVLEMLSVAEFPGRNIVIQMKYLILWEYSYTIDGNVKYV